MSNRDTVSVTGTGGNQSVTIDLSEGSFAPGVVNEAGATDEIEFAIEGPGAGSGDSLTVIGLPSADLITVGESGINLNDVDDIDVTTAGVEIHHRQRRRRRPERLGRQRDWRRGHVRRHDQRRERLRRRDPGGDGPDTLSGDADANSLQVGSVPHDLRRSR